jgi:hypothetical protein
LASSMEDGQEHGEYLREGERERASCLVCESERRRR